MSPDIQTAITPWIPALSALGGALLVGIFQIIRGRQGDSAAKGPTVEQIWSRLDKIEKLLDAERNGRYTLLRVFRAYVYRVQSGGTSELTPEEQHALDQSAEQENASS